MPDRTAPRWVAALSAVWNIPGRAWVAMNKAASITVWQRFGGALVVSALVLLVIWIIWKGPWSTDSELVRLEWLGRYGVMLIGALVICIVALFEFRLNFAASKTGITANVEGDDETRERHTTASVRESPPPEIPEDQQVKLP